MPDILGRLRSPRLASAPGTPNPGEMYYNSTANVLYYWNGTSWVTSGSTGGGTPVLAAAQILDVGVAGQIRAGRQLTAADFTALGLSAPRGLWNLSDLTDASGNARALTNKGSVTFASGINGAASTAAQFTGSTAQALYISDTGAADPFRIGTGSVGCWFRTAKRGTAQGVFSKWSASAGQQCWLVQMTGGFNYVTWYVSTTGSDVISCNGVSDVQDDRWHFLVGTADGATLRAYVDGVLEGSVSTPGATFGGSAPLNVGGLAADGATVASNPHFGRVDEAFVTADVLSDDQIRGLYCAKVPHGFAGTPTVMNLAVRRARKGGPFATTDFPSQPLRLHNFTAAAFTDQGSNNVALTPVGGLPVPVSGGDGAQSGAFSFNGAQSLSATDAGLPSGTATRSYGCWFKTAVTVVANYGLMAWGATPSNLVILYVNTNILQSVSGSDNVAGPFVADGQWHQVIVTEDNAAGDGVKRKVYLDGRLVAGSTVIGSITLAGANRFRVGATSDGTIPFTGQIDGAFVCGYALTEDQISTLYAKASQALGPSPKNAGDHIEFSDSTNIYLVLDTLETQHAVDLAVTG